LRAIGGWPVTLRPLPIRQKWQIPPKAIDACLLGFLLAALSFAAQRIIGFLSGHMTGAEFAHVILLSVFTLIRVVTLIALASLVWVPTGVWLGLRPSWARRAQPIAQFLAAFPANLLYPPFVLFIVFFHLNPDIWLTPLMILGTQWYILFNVTAGAAAFPGDMQEAANSFRLTGWLWWRKVMIPGILPYYVTGALTASGGSWNAAIVAEVASWGDTTLKAHGIGAYIADATAAGNMAHVVIGVAVMSMFVLLLNRTLWRPLYDYASRRLTLG
jgi:NitT/TauT family transport system permease protein